MLGVDLGQVQVGAPAIEAAVDLVPPVGAEFAGRVAFVGRAVVSGQVPLFWALGWKVPHFGYG